jgi:uncharacterized protein (TIGR00730 family)
MKSVVVFCSASDQVAPMYFSEISLLAKALVRANYRIVYGGGMTGLMGRLADVALAEGGVVAGVIPKYLAKDGILHPGLSELLIVDDLLDRKRKMLEMADAAIAFAGGIGTMDEVTEALALKQLGENPKPIIFHNFLQFWDPLFEFFDELRLRKMIYQNPDELYTVRESSDAVVEYLKSCVR